MIFSKLKYFRVPATVFAAAGPIDTVLPYDIIDPEIKTAKSYEKFQDSETGMDRLKRMFQLDEFEHISPEIHSIYNAGFLGLFIGLCYGGFLGSKQAYFNFMDRNQATAFSSHIDAKKKLQDSVAVSFAKGGWKLGWRMGLFAMTYVGISTCISVYRNKYTVLEYIVGGAATGALYKWKMGPRGMAAGGVVGGGLGTVAGLISVGLLKLTGTTMEEARYWQYKWKTERTNAYRDGFHIQLEGTELSFKDKNADFHDAIVGSKVINLKDLDDAETAPVVKKTEVTSAAQKIESTPVASKVETKSEDSKTSSSK